MFTIADLEVALRRSVSPTEQPYCEYLIAAITAYIEGETGISFSRQANKTVRYRADGRGIVELIGPVLEVQNISPLAQSNYYHYDGWAWSFSSWDGLSDIDGLAPYEVVDVTYTYGYELSEVPADIRDVAIQAVVGVLNPRGQDDLQERTVGDITYRYRFSEADFDAFGITTLNAYRGIGRTWRL